MKVLITGGAGFIGLHLANHILNEGCEVVLVDNFSRGVRDSALDSIQKSDKVLLRTADLMNTDDLNSLDTDFDIIFHLAAIIGVQNVLDHAYDVLKNNVLMLLNMIDYAKKQNHLKRFMFASTSEVYAGTLKYYGLDIPTKEETPLALTNLRHPRTSYMLSKIYGEAIMHQSGLPYTIFRPHNFYGPRMGMSHVIPELLRKAYNNEKEGELEVFSSTHRRTFCYIDDAVEMLSRLAVSGAAEGEDFNVGSETPEYTMKQVGEMVLKVTNKDFRIKELPPSPGSPERRCPSMQKTTAVIGYTAKTGLVEGIKKTFEWYKNNIFEGKETGAK